MTRILAHLASPLSLQGLISWGACGATRRGSYWLTRVGGCLVQAKKRAKKDKGKGKDGKKYKEYAWG
jgi:hypothetical protein